jgi:peptidyl-dipeptidase Dcp
MKKLTLLLLLCASTVAAQTNPFFSESTLPYQAPPFDKITDADYQPAIEEGMKQGLAEIEAIANNPDAPTFANTMEALEKSGRLLARVQRSFGGMTQANTNPALQKIQTEMAPKLSAYRDAISLNPKLFARVKAVYDNRASLNSEQKRLVERSYKDFVRSGALLSDEDKTKLRALNKESSQLTNQFRNKILADTNAGAIVVDDVKDLEGLSEADIAAAAAAAKTRSLDGKWVLTLQNTTQQPAQTYLKNRALREKLYRSSSTRGIHGGENDVTSIITRLAQLRQQRAKLLGYPTFAAYALEDQMSKSPDNAIKLMTDMVPATNAKVREEAARLQKIAPEPLQPCDWQYYAEQVRKADYDLDENQVRPYFEINRVLQDGVFFAATKLYGITFKERKDIPVYQPDVRVFEVFDNDGKGLALFYFDPYSRSNKQGGAWTSSFVGQSKLFGTKTVNYNVENFTKPAAGQPALLSFSDVTTMFHEFGHALHGIFSNVTYPGSGGTPRDWVEFPSQFNEHWALEPTVFANYAKHYKTGEPMPAAIVAKLRKSLKFNQGYATSEYLQAALLDQSWHTMTTDALVPDAAGFEADSLKHFQISTPEIPPRYRSTYFSHIWAGGYSAAYYAYLWSEVLDDDAYYWFRENGGMTRANGDRFRKMILSRGGMEDPAEMYKAFRGRDPKVEPLLIERGLKSE